MSATAAEIVRLRLLGKTYSDISRETGVKSSAIEAALAGAGLVKRRKPLDPERAAQMRSRRDSYQQIADELGCGLRQVGRLLATAGATGAQVFGGGKQPVYDYAAIAAMKAAGMSYKEIAAETGASEGTIYVAIAALGGARHYKRVDRAKAAALREAGRTRAEIAAELGCSPMAVRYAQRDERAAA